ncbi:MAG: Mur ligase family protein [Minisyncoccia bacterium]
MKLSDIKKVHFIGIGGIGISGLARLFVHEGKEVSGTNDNPSPQTLDTLREMGVSISLDATVLPEADLYVYSEAWHNMNPTFLQKAFDSGIPTINYFDALGMVANEYYLIAVAGSHGKTTTTAVLIDIFEEAGLDPSAIVGSLRAKTKSNYRAGKSKYFIVEACEYRRDFMSLTPDVLVITNIEHEHVDYYKNLGEVQQAFHELALQVREGGTVIANLSDDKVRPCIENLACSIVDYSKYFDPTQKLTMPGVHNQMNAAAAKAAAEFAGISTEVSKNALENFAGTWRRFEYKGEVNGAKIYDDYGHHPTEIKATVAGARELYPERKLTLVFQSHTYSRTQELFADFIDALGTADKIILLPIYAAREDNLSGVTHTKLAAMLEKNNKNVVALDTFEAVADELRENIGQDDLVLVMGAGNVTNVTKLLFGIQ